MENLGVYLVLGIFAAVIGFIFFAVIAQVVITTIGALGLKRLYDKYMKESK